MKDEIEFDLPEFLSPDLDATEPGVHDTEIDGLALVEEHELQRRLVEYAHAVKSGKPIGSFVGSAVAMSDLVLELFESRS